MAARRQVGVERVDQRLVGRVDQRPDEAEQDEDDDHREPENRELVVEELAERELPAARDYLDLAALGPGHGLADEVAEPLDQRCRLNQCAPLGPRR